MLSVTRITYPTALRIAVNALDGVLDKAGEPMVSHAIRMAETFRDEDAKIVAVLHDVLEDGGATHSVYDHDGSLVFCDDVDWFLTPQQSDALYALTRNPGDDYLDDYISGILAAGPLAMRVKLADINDHLDPSRVAFAPLGKIAKYEEAKRRLEKELFPLFASMPKKDLLQRMREAQERKDWPPLPVVSREDGE